MKVKRVGVLGAGLMGGRPGGTRWMGKLTGAGVSQAEVDLLSACLEDDPADQVRVDAPRRLDLASGGLLDLLDDRRGLLVRELQRRRQLDGQTPFRFRHQPLELARDVLDLADAALLGREPEEVAQQLLGASEQVLEHGGLRARLELRVAQDRAQLGHVGDGTREVGQLLVHLWEAPVLLGRLEESLGVDPVRNAQFLRSSSTEKSSVWIASSISRR